MSSIAALEPLSEYGPSREEQSDRIESSSEKATDEVVAPFVKAASEQQDQKTTVQSFQYTGKGSFIDKVF